MDIDKIINEVEEMHPYKKAGDRDSYSQYAEGWRDACDILGEHIKQCLCEGNQANSENANCVSIVLPTDEQIDNIVQEDFDNSEKATDLNKFERQIALAGMRAGAKKLKDWIEGNC